MENIMSYFYYIYKKQGHKWTDIVIKYIKQGHKWTVIEIISCIWDYILIKFVY